jgi:hypothetical protein
MNAMLDEFALDHPDDVADGFLLLIFASDSGFVHNEVPWALLRTEAAAREVAGRLTEVGLIAGFNDINLEAGDEIVVRLLEFKGGRRQNGTELRRVEVTEAGLREHAASLPSFAG